MKDAKIFTMTNVADNTPSISPPSLMVKEVNVLDVQGSFKAIRLQILYVCFKSSYCPAALYFFTYIAINLNGLK